ncbi:MAG: YihY/virulence factor BrkB family protein [Bacteroidetes bacterium]|nr:YihY/virulence factor BrkB family protein [Bacteroidota bacterium]MBS1974962.1 YihY/virulence factor BrkB family protein [Bacteroidota bacterium]
MAGRLKIEKFIYDSFPFRFLADKSKKIILPGFEGVPLYDVITFFTSQVKKVGLNDRARAISFSFLTAIPAATIFLCTLIPYLPIARQIEKQLLFITKDITPNQNTYILVRNFLEDFFGKPRAGLLSFGFVLAIFYSSNALMGIMRSFDKSLIYNTKRNIFQARWMAIKLTALVILFLMGTVILLATQDELLRNILKWMNIKSHSAKWVFKTLRWIIIIPLFYYTIAFIYKYGPALHKRWKLRSPGTLLATVLIISLTYLFSYWVNKFSNYNKVYGSIGTILILMVLIYLNSLMLLIGYELNVSIHHLKLMADDRALKEKIS